MLFEFGARAVGRIGDADEDFAVPDGGIGERFAEMRKPGGDEESDHGADDRSEHGHFVDDDAVRPGSNMGMPPVGKG